MHNQMPESKMNLRKGENQMRQRYDEAIWTANKVERFRRAANKLNELLREPQFGAFPIPGASDYIIDIYGEVINIKDGTKPKIVYSKNGYKKVTIKCDNGKFPVLNVSRTLVMAIINQSKYRPYLRLFKIKKNSRWKLEVDHIDNNRDNNQISNLQILTRVDNVSKINRKNNTGHKGIYKWVNPSNNKVRYFVNILLNNRRFAFNYSDLDKAIAKRDEIMAKIEIN